MNNDVKNICAQVSVWTFVFDYLQYILLRTAVAGSSDTSVFNIFEEVLNCFPRCSYSFLPFVLCLTFTIASQSANLSHGRYLTLS